MITERLTALRLNRHFDAAPERVFNAWLDPKVAGRWLFTSPISEGHSVQIDARVGGRWTIVDRREGTDYTAIGEYLEIDRPKRLAFSFSMPQFSDRVATVTIDIKPEGTGCLLSITHECVPWENSAETEKGWAAMFDQLAALG